MTTREAAEQRLAKAFAEVYIHAPLTIPESNEHWTRQCSRLAAEAIDAALDEHHCGCCDGGPWEQIDPWDAVCPKEVVK
jgi:hypothetical protein